MPSYLLTFLEELSKETGVSIPPEGVKDGWSSELHENLSDWFEKISKCIRLGPLLIVDYSINAKRYYHPNRNSGTIISYKDQFASSDVLKEPGESDITAHLCIESIEIQAKKSNLELIEKLSQEEALLNLGWGERYAFLRKYKNKDLAKMLDRRESLLRLIDPTSLGNFMWHIFQVNNLPNHMIDLRKTLNLKIPKSYPLG